jgi:hypothetical protein
MTLGVVILIDNFSYSQMTWKREKSLTSQTWDNLYVSVWEQFREVERTCLLCVCVADGDLCNSFLSLKCLHLRVLPQVSPFGRLSTTLQDGGRVFVREVLSSSLGMRWIRGKCYSLRKQCDVLYMCILSVWLFLSFVCDFRAGLFGLFRSWLGEVLGVELKPTVDISCAKYQYTGESHVFTSALQKNYEQALILACSS